MLPLATVLRAQLWQRQWQLRRRRNLRAHAEELQPWLRGGPTASASVPVTCAPLHARLGDWTCISGLTSAPHLTQPPYCGHIHGSRDRLGQALHTGHSATFKAATHCLPAWLCRPSGNGAESCGVTAGAGSAVDTALKASLSLSAGMAVLWQLFSGSFGLFWLSSEVEVEVALKFNVRRRCLCSPSASKVLRLLPLPSSPSSPQPCNQAAHSHDFAPGIVLEPEKCAPLLGSKFAVVVASNSRQEHTLLKFRDILLVSDCMLSMWRRKMR